MPGSGGVGWVGHGSGDGSGVGARVGFHHKTLAAFLGAFTDADLNIREMREVTPPVRPLPKTANAFQAW
jgi:hypothetical protein